MSREAYLAAKGRPAPKVEIGTRRSPPPPLSEAEKEAIAGRVALVKEHMPEVMDFIKAAHAAGMVDGLRCIESVTVFGEGGGDAGCQAGSHGPLMRELLGNAFGQGAGERDGHGAG